MADDLKQRGGADADRININEKWEFESWSKKLGVSEDQLKQAVKKAGPMAKDVRRELGK